METAATKLLESATIKTLHAHSFSRSSTQASLVLSDLLARYLALLSETCAKYAHHAGRSGLSVYDAVAALEEMGVGVEELSQYCSIEAKELNRYASHSARRIEDLNEFKAQLSLGLRQDRDDAIPLQFQPYDVVEYDSEEEDEDIDMEVLESILTRPNGIRDEDEDDAMVVDTHLVRSPSPLERKTPPPRQSTPPLPLSPVSNPSSPSRKRPRTANWKPPPHIPSFLPPFPSINTDPPLSVPASPHDPQLPETQSTDLMPPPPDVKVDKLLPLTVAQTMTSSAASDYLVQVPYSQSSLSSVPEWHLPTPPSSSKSQSRKNPLPTLQMEPALFKAYHHILTHRPPSTLPPSTVSRHKVAMAFISQTQKNPRWDASDTLFSTVAPCPPRVAAVGASYPVAINDSINGKTDAKDKEIRFPPTIPRPVSTTERLTPLLGQQSNRIPELARHVLPPVVMNRTTRLAHPPVLHRGTKPLLYGRGIPAPWNSHATPPSDNPNVPATPIASTAKEKDRENGEAPPKPLMPDAQLFATWDFETKDYKVPLPSAHRHRNQVRSAPSGSSGVISLPLNATPRTKSGPKHG
ncbi:hypothetical protein P691DRAFT_699504 [Macrolepiota fuliginosa MF-IS2]|uniref:Bromodomain associated domain-containing protein n=1 Tax=Macrolepiota fuliginosa MF-IS2 TaxID=1400762 RepID=A0A9P5XJ51_9AGAR|nr:hypothetical protein P691DRAFT_699504 [Macrolepiota fuliginosa MF-IS2]